MNMMEKSIIFVVMDAGKFLLKNQESGRKTTRLDNSHTYDKI